jgi:hypothetical protein
MRHVRDSGWLQIQRPALSEKLLDEIRAEHMKAPFALFFSYFYSVHVDPGVIGDIRGLGIVTVNFFCDAVHSFDLVSEIAPAYDCSWVPERQALARYRKAGAKPMHLPMAANPRLWATVPGVRRDIGVLFAGMLYADRPRILAQLLNRGIPLTVFSGSAVVPYAACSAPGLATGGCPSYCREALRHLSLYGPVSLGRRILRWMPSKRALRTVTPVNRGAVPFDQMPMLYARSYAVVNLSGQYDRDEPGGKLKYYVKLRDFEVPMSRSLCMIQRSEDLHFCYEPDIEVVTWSTVDELRDKIRFYEANTEAAERVRQAGHRRALSEHTWQERFDVLLRSLSLN